MTTYMLQYQTNQIQLTFILPFFCLFSFQCHLKIEDHKLNWKVESRVGSLQNADHKPGGGEKKVTKLVWRLGIWSQENVPNLVSYSIFFLSFCGNWKICLWEYSHSISWQKILMVITSWLYGTDYRQHIGHAIAQFFF